MRQKWFYEAPLELELDPVSSDVAFGFVITTAGGIVTARSVPQYEGIRCSDGENDGARIRPVVQSGLQDVHEGRQVAAVQGRIVRLLDMTNESSEKVQASVIRLVAELRLQQYDPKILCRALQRVRGSCWLCLKPSIRAAWLDVGE